VSKPGTKIAVERIDAEAELMPVAVLIRKTAALVVADDDAGVERTVAVDRADLIVRRRRAVVEIGDACRLAAVARDVQLDVGGVEHGHAGAAFVDRRIGEIDDRIRVRIL
jgi:hypothetical protein